MVFQDGTVGKLTSKDNSFAKKTVIAYSLDSKGYAVEDTGVTSHTNVSATANGIYNGYVIETASGSSIDFKSGYNAANTTRFILGADADLFDVSNAKAGDQDSVTEINTLGQNQSTCYVVEDGYIKYIFVNDNNAVFAKLINSTGSSLANVNGAALANSADMSVASGYTVTVAGATRLVYTYTVSSQAYTGDTNGAATPSVFTMPANTTAGVSITTATGATLSATGDVDFTLTTPAPSATNTITGGGATRTVTVNVDNTTSSVVLTGTKTAAQTVTVGGTDATDVSAAGTATAPTYTVNTSSIATGGSKTFTLTVAEPGMSSITYTVTVTVAATTLTIDGETIADATYAKNEASVTALSVDTVSDSSGTATYQWKQSTDNGGTWTDVGGATSNSYTPVVTTSGTTQYKCVVTSQDTTVSVDSTVATITVQSIEAGSLDSAFTAGQNETRTVTHAVENIDDGTAVTLTWYGTDSTYTTEDATLTSISTTPPAVANVSGGEIEVTITEDTGASLAANTYYYTLTVGTLVFEFTVSVAA